MLRPGDEEALRKHKRKRRKTDSKQSHWIPPKPKDITLPNFPASQLPEGFPPELAFRALAAYAFLRTVSCELRLSPFTPNVFLRALYLPYPSKLLGQIHCSILRVLLASFNMGYSVKPKGNSTPGVVLKKRRVDGIRWPLRAGDNLTFLDNFTWPLFFDDYVHLTADVLWAFLNDDENQTDFRNIGMPDLTGMVLEEDLIEQEQEESLMAPAKMSSHVSMLEDGNYFMESLGRSSRSARRGRSTYTTNNNDSDDDTVEEEAEYEPIENSDDEEYMAPRRPRSAKKRGRGRPRTKQALLSKSKPARNSQQQQPPNKAASQNVPMGTAYGFHQSGSVPFHFKVGGVGNNLNRQLPNHHTGRHLPMHKPQGHTTAKPQQQQPSFQQYISSETSKASAPKRSPRKLPIHKAEGPANKKARLEQLDNSNGVVQKAVAADQVQSMLPISNIGNARQLQFQQQAIQSAQIRAVIAQQQAAMMAMQGMGNASQFASTNKQQWQLQMQINNAIQAANMMQAQVGMQHDPTLAQSGFRYSPPLNNSDRFYPQSMRAPLLPNSSITARKHQVTDEVSDALHTFIAGSHFKPNKQMGSEKADISANVTEYSKNDDKRKDNLKQETASERSTSKIGMPGASPESAIRHDSKLKDSSTAHGSDKIHDNDMNGPRSSISGESNYVTKSAIDQACADQSAGFAEIVCKSEDAAAQKHGYEPKQSDLSIPSANAVGTLDTKAASCDKDEKQKLADQTSGLDEHAMVASSPPGSNPAPASSTSNAGDNTHPVGPKSEIDDAPLSKNTSNNCQVDDSSFPDKISGKEEEMQRGMLDQPSFEKVKSRELFSRESNQDAERAATIMAPSAMKDVEALDTPQSGHHAVIKESGKLLNGDILNNKKVQSLQADTSKNKKDVIPAAATGVLATSNNEAASSVALASPAINVDVGSPESAVGLPTSQTSATLPVGSKKVENQSHSGLVENNCDNASKPNEKCLKGAEKEVAKGTNDVSSTKNSTGVSSLPCNEEKTGLNPLNGNAMDSESSSIAQQQQTGAESMGQEKSNSSMTPITAVVDTALSNTSNVGKKDDNATIDDDIDSVGSGKTEESVCFADREEQWPQFQPVRTMRSGVPYHRLPLEEKLKLLEFLIDEILTVDTFAAEFSRRNVSNFFGPPYGCLPTEQELDNLENEDECAVCKGEGDLLCCDGCLSSYHKVCIDMKQNDELPEGRWLCPECELVDPVKFGSLRGGKKSCMDWFTLGDMKMAERVKNQQEGSYARLENAANENGNLHSSENVLDGNELINPSGELSKQESLEANQAVQGNQGNVVAASQCVIDQTHDAEESASGQPLARPNGDPAAAMSTQQSVETSVGGKQAGAGDAPVANNGSRNEGFAEILAPVQSSVEKNTNGTVAGSATEESQPEDIQTKSDMEYIVVHGFVFARRCDRGRNDHVPLSDIESSQTRLPLSADDVSRLLKSVGPELGLSWPLAQIPFAALESGGPVVKRGIRHPKVDSFFATKASYDPSYYQSKYRKAPFSRIMFPGAASNAVQLLHSEYENACNSCNVRKLSDRLSPNFIGDRSLALALKSETSLFDPYQLIKDYMVKLENILNRANLVDEFWGTRNKELKINVWQLNVKNSESIPRLAALLLKLIDATHRRAFSGLWFTIAGHKETTESAVEVAEGFDGKSLTSLTSDWTPEAEMRKLRWERSPLANVRSVLAKEGHTVVDWVYGEDREISQEQYPKRKKRKQILSTRSPTSAGKIIQPDFGEGYQGLPLHAKANLAPSNLDPTIASVQKLQQVIEKRVITGIASEVEKQAEKPNSESEIPIKAAVESVPREKQTDSAADSGKEINEHSKQPQKMGRRKRTRRSSRVTKKQETPEDFLNSVIANSGKSQNELSMETIIEAQKMAKLVEVKEKTSAIPFVDTLKWPICGRLLFKPIGTLSVDEMKRLGRNAGGIMAQSVSYTGTYEVGEVSHFHVWRKNLQRCISYEQMLLQIRVLESYIERSVSFFTCRPLYCDICCKTKLTFSHFFYNRSCNHVKHSPNVRLPREHRCLELLSALREIS